MKLFLHIGMLIFVVSCTNTVSIKNGQKGKLTASYQLVVSGEKKILLDDETAPKPPYMQMIKNEHGVQMLTLLNPYKNAIYFYEYTSGVLQRKIEYEREGSDGILSLTGYYIRNMDSIYVYNRSLVELILTDSVGHVKQRMFLHDNRENYGWAMYYPQYSFSTVNPIIEINGKLILTGMFPFDMRDSLIHKCRFTASVDLKSSDVKFMHTYPEELYGFGANWPDEIFTQPYPELTPESKIIYSFPISHDVYISQLDVEDYKTVYAGANVAGAISSMDHQNPSLEVGLTHVLQYDLYSGIRYDSYRNVYYRFLSQGIPDATVSTPIGSKPVVVVIMDEQFNYLGETLIGTGIEWNCNNAFVTLDGLVIEYIDPNADSEEEYIVLKTFIMKEI